jgi:hypothetical protein
MLNDVLAQSAFLERGSFATSSDPDDKQMMAIANRVAIEIRDYYNWSDLRKTHVINMFTDQTRYVLPSDFRFLVPDSAWETEGSRRVELPVPEGRWFLYKHTVFSDGGTIRARFYGNEIEVHDPEGGESFTLEYITDWVVENSQGALKDRFTADDDLFRLDDQLFVLGVQAHWAMTKMLPQAGVWHGNYMDKMAEAISRDAGSRTLGGAGNGYDWLRSRSPYTPLYRP